MSRWRHAWALVLVAMVACNTRTSTESAPRGVSRGAPGQDPGAVTQPATPYGGNDPLNTSPMYRPNPGRFDPTRVGSLPRESPPGSAATAEASAAPAAPPAPARDLNGEFTDALGTLEGCATNLPANTPPTVTISVSATVMATGSVSRASVSAPDLSATAVACIRQRAEAVHIAPVAGAPLSINASVVLHAQALSPAPNASPGPDERWGWRH